MNAELSAKWAELFARVNQCGQTILELAGDDTIAQGEGLRYLTRLMRYVFMLQFESGDPDFPRVFSPGGETQKFLGDSPDYHYEMAAISDKRCYRVTGTRGDAEKLHLSTYSLGPGGVRCTGHLATPDLIIGPDGRFECVLSPTRVPGNWIPIEEGAFHIQIRNFFKSHHRENPARVKIEAIDGPPWPEPYDAEAALGAITRTLAQITRSVPFATDFQTSTEARVGTNAFETDQAVFQAMGGNTATWYVQGVYDLAPGEGLIVESDEPGSSYFSFQLNNRWFESLDYAHRSIYYSSYTATREAAGGMRFLISAENRGFANWLDIAEHPKGIMSWKWNDVERPPQITARKVLLDELA